MKKLLIILAVLLLLLISALAVFVVTFDADRFRPFLISRLESSLGMPVDIQKIALGWHDGPALDLKGLRIFTGEDRRETALFVQRAAANVAAAPLMNGRVEVRSLVIKEPEINLIMTKEGTLKGFQKPPAQPVSGAQPSSSESAAVSPAAAGAVFVLSFDTISIENAVVSFRDEALGMNAPVSIEDIDITLSDVSWHEPVKLAGKGSLFSGRQNIDMSAVIKYDAGRGTLVISRPLASINLDMVEREKLARSLSYMKDLSLPEKMAGTLRAEAAEIRIQEGEANYDIRVVLQNGMLQLEDLAAPLENIEITALVNPGSLQIQSGSLNVAGAQGAVSGLTNLTAEPVRSDIRLSLVGMELQKLAPPPSPSDVYATGRLTVSFEGGAAGLDMLSVQRTVSGGGQVVLNQGVIRNLNITREVLNKLSMIPGLAARLDSRLSPEYKQKIDKKDTALEPIQVPFSVQGPIWTVPKLTVVSETFSLTGTARGDWTNETFQAQFSIFFDRDLSDALIRSVEELRFLAAPDGRLEIPGSLQGAGEKISFVPNVPNLASRVVAGKAQQVLDGLFERKKGPAPAAPGTEPAPAGTSPAPADGQSSKGPASAEMLLGQLLGEVLGGGSDKSNTQSRE